MFVELFNDIPVITDDYDTIAATDELAPCRDVFLYLTWLIVYGTVAKYADIRCIEEIWDTTRNRNSLLSLVRQASLQCLEFVEEFAL